jgi:FixJ family two-component response regulator
VETVSIVDDDAAVLTACSRVLKAAGYLVQVFGSG